MTPENTPDDDNAVKPPESDYTLTWDAEYPTAPIPLPRLPRRRLRRPPHLHQTLPPLPRLRLPPNRSRRTRHRRPRPHQSRRDAGQFSTTMPPATSPSALSADPPRHPRSSILRPASHVFPSAPLLRHFVALSAHTKHLPIVNTCIFNVYNCIYRSIKTKKCYLLFPRSASR
jgi:hypothetical protein